MQLWGRPHIKLLALFAEISVLGRRIAIVMGPTPPGTGVIAEAILLASSHPVIYEGTKLVYCIKMAIWLDRAGPDSGGMGNTTEENGEGP